MKSIGLVALIGLAHTVSADRLLGSGLGYRGRLDRGLVEPFYGTGLGSYYGHGGLLPTDLAYRRGFDPECELGLGHGIAPYYPGHLAYPALGPAYRRTKRADSAGLYDKLSAERDAEVELGVPGLGCVKKVVKNIRRAEAGRKGKREVGVEVGRRPYFGRRYGGEILV